MNSSVIYSILIHCFKRHPDEMDQIFSCLDTKREAAKRYNILMKGNKIAKDLNMDLFLLVLDTYGTLILAAIGIFVNIIGCYQLLRRSERKKMISLMLVSILSFDILYLAFKLVRSVEYFIPVPNEYLSPYYTLADAGARFSLTDSILMMVAIGRVRYQAVRKPIHQRIFLSSRNKRLQELLKYLIPTVILSLAFTFPIYFEMDNEPIQLGGDAVQSSSSKIRFSPLYSFFVLGIWNFVLLGVLPFVCLIYFSCKMITHTRKNQLPSREDPNAMGIINETSEKITKSLVAIIVLFIILHSPRLISSVGEYYFLTIPNKDQIAIELGYGIPIWLKVLGPINEFCTVLNACLNIIIYRYLNCSGILRYCLMRVPSCFSTSTRTRIPSSMPIANEHRTNTRVEEHGSVHPSDNGIKTDISGSSAMFSVNRSNILSQENDSRNSSDYPITFNAVNQTVTFRAQCHEH